MFDGQQNNQGMSNHTKFVRKNKWCTVEILWNCRKKIVFIGPPDARIRVRYGVGWLSANCRVQILDGNQQRIVEVNGWSVFMAKVQIYSNSEEFISYSL